MKKIFGFKEKTPLGFCDGPQMTVSEFFFGENPNFPKYHTTYRPVVPIHRAAAEGDEARLEIMITLRQCDVNDKDHKDRTALHFACVYGRLPIVTTLLNNNCKVDALDKNNVTPLIKSVQCWKRKCATILLEHGANPHIMDSSGNCALHYAVYNGDGEMAELLLQYNANIEQKTRDGFTPLLLALREKRVEMAEVLVKRGANIHVADDLQRNTLIYAIRCGSKEMVTLLLQEGIDFSFKDVFGWTALRYAVEGHCTFKNIFLDFEEKMHKNRTGINPGTECQRTSHLLEQKHYEDDSLVRIFNHPGPGPSLPIPTPNEDECNCDSKSTSESTPTNYASKSPEAVDQRVKNRVKRTMEARVENDLTSMPTQCVTEVRESTPNEAVETLVLSSVTPEPEMSVEEDMSDDSENSQLLTFSEHLPQIRGDHLSVAVDQRREKNVHGQMKDSDLEVTLRECQNKHDVRRNNQSLNIYENLLNTPIGHVSVTTDQRGKICGHARDTCRKHPQSKSTIERRDSVQNVAPDTEHVRSFREDFPKEYAQFKLTTGKKYSVPSEASATKQVKSHSAGEPAINLSSEEEPKRHEDYEKNQRVHMFKRPQPKNIVYLSMDKDESIGDIVSSQEKAEPVIKLLSEEQERSEGRERSQTQHLVEKRDSFSSEESATKHVKYFCTDSPTEYPELKSNIEKKDSTDVSSMEYEKSSLGEVTMLQERPEQRRMRRHGYRRKPRKPVLKLLQSRWSARVSVAPQRSKENLRAAPENEATTAQLRSEEKQTGWYGYEKMKRKPVFERLQPKRMSPRVSADPQQSGGNTGATQEKQATTVQVRSEEEQTGWNGNEQKDQKESRQYITAGPEKEATTIQRKSEEGPTAQDGCEKMKQKCVFERLQQKWSVRASVDAKQRVDNTDPAEMKYSPAEHPKLKSTQITLEKEDSVPSEDSTMKHEKSFLAEQDLELISEEEEDKHYSNENTQSLARNESI